MVRFYTLPPRRIQYPYVFVNFFNYKELFRRRFEHAILDTGVERLFDHGKLKEYPSWFKRKYVSVCKQLTEIYGDKIWCVVPDYPDDYVHNRIPDNVEKTLRNIEAVSYTHLTLPTTERV